MQLRGEFDDDGMARVPLSERRLAVEVERHESFILITKVRRKCCELFLAGDSREQKFSHLLS